MKWQDLGWVLRMMSHLGRKKRMISQVIRPQNHSKKKKKSKNQINQKKKKRAKIQAVTNVPLLKKSRPRDLVAQGTSMTWGHRFQLGYPFSFIYCSPKNFRWSTYLPLGWLFPNFDGSLLIYQILLLTLIFSYLRWCPMDLIINFLLVMKTFLFLSWGCCKPSRFNKCLELIMAIFWRDLTALIYLDLFPLARACGIHQRFDCLLSWAI